MTEPQILYNCLLDETYNNNKVHFEILLNKIQDKDLLKGFLIGLILNQDKLEIEKETILDITSRFLSKEDLTKPMFEYHDYFKSKLIPILEQRQIGKTVKLLSSLMTFVQSGDIGPLTEEILISSNESLENFKLFLIDQELYELVKNIDQELDKRKINQLIS